MAVTVNTSGSVTPTVGTETDLATITAAGIYQLWVNMANLAAGDIVEFRAYTKVRSGDAEGLALPPASYGPFVPEVVNVNAIALVVPVSCRWTIKQVSGTARAFPWGIYSTGA